MAANRSKVRFLFAALLLCQALPDWVRAEDRGSGKQTGQPRPGEDEADDSTPDPDRFEPLALPIIGGSTDIGVLVGATAAISRLKQGFDPYRWKGDFTAAISMKRGPGSLDFPVNYFAVAFDIPGLLGHRLRLFPRVEFKKLINAGYYGLGNQSEPGGGTGENAFRRNQYRNTAPKARLSARLALGRGFWLLGGATYRYVMPGLYEASKLAEDAEALDDNGDPLIRGIDDHAIVEVLAGMVYDTRDDEANPTCGVLYTLELWYSPGSVIGTEYRFGSAVLDTRSFVPLVGEYLVMALRLRGDALFGDVPFHEMDLDLIRGIPARRYHGMVKVLGSAELRSIFYRFSVFKEHFGFGAVAFVDTGRVWADYRSQPELDGEGVGLKWGVGAGLRAVWGETRVVRTDISYSPDKAEISPDQPFGIYVRMNHFF